MAHADTAWPICRAGGKGQTSRRPAGPAGHFSGRWARVCQEVVVGHSAGGEHLLKRQGESLVPQLAQVRIPVTGGVVLASGILRQRPVRKLALALSLVPGER